MADLTTKYLGLELRNPIIAASSGLTDAVEKLISLEKNGIAAVILKSMFEEEILQEMQTNLNRQSSARSFFPETVDYYDYLDLPKESPEKYLELIQDAKRNLSIPVIASINCISPGQWTLFPKMIQNVGADAIELNLFIVSSDPKYSAEENEKRYLEIISEVRKHVSIPLSLKVSYYFSNLDNILKRFSESGIDGLVLFNRFYTPDVNVEKIELTSDSVISSPSDMNISMRWIALMSGKVKCSLAASTGIHDGNAVIKQLLVGANAVQIASALYKYGPGIIQEMLTELNDWMDRKAFLKIEDFRGKLSHSQKNTAYFERFQFMKHFREYKTEYM